MKYTNLIISWGLGRVLLHLGVLAVGSAVHPSVHLPYEEWTDGQKWVSSQRFADIGSITAGCCGA